ncbi:hypothetical protein OENI_450011 [Oenococcus oeni]|nr:hypothetical protein OENI_450011 [Oenococcus oeni]
MFERIKNLFFDLKNLRKKIFSVNVIKYFVKYLKSLKKEIKKINGIKFKNKLKNCLYNR